MPPSSRQRCGDLRAQIANRFDLPMPTAIVFHRLCVITPIHAPLAQSVERFHGKEEVVSSILTGGSVCLCLLASSVRLAGSAVSVA